ncbi:MAG: DUF167 domain-containing protein [Candidatus Taylorbacteria bacterium]
MSKTIHIRVSAGARVEKVEVMPDGILKVRVNAPPERGKANERVVELLAEYFKLSKARIAIIRGHTNREKVVLVEE